MSHSAMKQLTYTVDLNETTRKVYLDGVFVTDDHEGHQFNLLLYRGNTPVQLPSGVAVHGYFTRYSDNTTLTLEKGTASGNVASIKLDKLCYALPGQFALVIKVMEGEAISALFYAEGSMVISKTGKVIDAGNVIPSLDDLLAKIADMEAATSDGRAAAQEARDAGAQAVGIAQDAAGEALAAAETVKSIYEVKADAIVDESARAASHSLHAQDGPLAVTLYGKTTETGTGDKSTDNPYVISGVDAAEIRAGGKNLFDASYRNSINGGVSANRATVTEENGVFTVVATNSDLNVWHNSGTGRLYDTSNGTKIYARKGVALTISFSNALFAKNFVSEYDANGACLGFTQVTMNGGVGTYTVKYENTAFVTLRFGMQDSVAGTTYTTTVQVEYGTVATDYEPYNANVITPALLPDGAPLMGNGTVDDTVENDVLSGCDKKIVLNGTTGAINTDSNWFYSPVPSDMNTVEPYYTGTLTVIKNAGKLADGFIALNTSGSHFVFRLNGVDKTTADYKAYLAANPLTVFYRSTDYTPDKDLMVCKVVRKYGAFEFAGPFWDVKTGEDGTPVYIGDLNTNGKSILREGFSESFNFKPGGWGQLSKGDGQWLHTNHIGVCWNFASIDEANAWVSKNPLRFVAGLATPETYMTDPLPLRKPAGMEKVTITGSAETAVTYPHETKHYIDSKISELVTLALANQ